MTKRINKNEGSSSMPQIKKSRTEDAENLIGAIEKMEITSKCSFNALKSIENEDSNRVTQLRDDFQETLQHITVLLDTQNEDITDLRNSIDLLKRNILRLFSNVMTEDIIDQLFLDIVDILWRVRFNTNIERFINLEYFTRIEYALKQAQLFSEQYFINKRKMKSKSVLSMIETKLLDDDPVCHKEINIEICEIITCMAQIARKSKIFAQKLLIQKSSTHLEPLDAKTVVELFNDIVISCIKDTQFIHRNLGLVMALAELLRSITIQYGEFTDIDQIDESLVVLFELVLRVATYDIEIMMCLSESFVNIAKHPSRLKLLTQMCILYSAKNPDYSLIYKLHQVEMNGCKFHIFFMLLNHVFRLYESEHIKGNSLRALIQITKNFNFLSYIILANDVDMKFLCKAKDVRCTCYCYKYFMMGSLILNDILLKNQNSNINHYKTIIETVTNGLVVLNSILNYTKNNSAHWEIRFPVMNELYVWMKFNNFKYYNHSRTRIHLNNFASIKEGDFHDFFLRRFNVNPILPSDENESLDENNNQAKRPKLVLMKMTKDDLLNEIANDFKSDEIVTYGYDKQRI